MLRLKIIYYLPNNLFAHNSADSCEKIVYGHHWMPTTGALLLEAANPILHIFEYLSYPFCSLEAFKLTENSV